MRWSGSLANRIYAFPPPPLFLPGRKGEEWRSGDLLLHEVSVPAASYRSGRRRSAIGVVSVRRRRRKRRKWTGEEEEEGVGDFVLVYSNLWLPDRMGGLALYLALAAAFVASHAISWLAARGGGGGRGGGRGRR